MATIVAKNMALIHSRKALRLFLVLGLLFFQNFQFIATTPDTLMDKIKQPAPAYFMQEAGIIVKAHPNKYGFAYYMILGHKTPET